MTISDKVWQQAEISKSFLEGVRGAIPLAAQQMEIMLKIIEAACPKVESFLDLGCGDGVLGRAILAKYPDASGIFLDFSEPMLEAAKSKVENQDKVEFIWEDFGEKDWVISVQNQGGFDVIVSGFAIHHQTDERKKDSYAV